MKFKVNNKKYHFWILQTGEPIHFDKFGYRPMRLINLSNFLCSKGFSSTIFTSKFNHINKEFRKVGRDKKFNKFIDYIFLNSIGYKKNISLKRMIDHLYLFFSLVHKLFSYKGKRPNLIFIGYPPIEISFLMLLYAKIKSIPCILDVKDQWPEIFERIGEKGVFQELNNKNKFKKLFYDIKPIFFKFIFFPYKVVAIYIFKNVDIVSTISRSFLEWIYFYSDRKKNKKDFIFPLVAKPINLKVNEKITCINWWKSNFHFNKNSLKIAFIGSLNNNFSFYELKNSLVILDKLNLEYQVFICGIGPQLKKLKEVFAVHKEVYFPGWVSQSKAKTLYEFIDIILAPYINTNDFMDSIPNKVIDSLSYGKPILSSLKGEVESLINFYNIGFSYESSQDIVNFICSIKKDKYVLKSMEENCKNLYLKEFEFEMIYEKVIYNILSD